MMSSLSAFRPILFGWLRQHRATVLLMAAYALLTVDFTWPILSTGAALGIADWDPILVYQLSVLKNVYEYGQAPFWNPWVCGGNVLWQNPQVALLSPAYPLTLVAGPVVSMKINIVLHYLAGGLGMYLLLTRGFGLRAWWSVVFLTACFTFAGGIALHLAVGHAPFLSYFYLPWILWLTLVALNGPLWRGSIAAAAVLAFGVWNGGIHMAFMTGVALTCFAAFATLFRRELRPALVLATITVFSLLFAAPKLLPVLAFLRESRLVDIRYIQPNPDVLSWNMLTHSLLDPFQYKRMMLAGQNYGWHEYGNYSGSLFVLLAIASLAWLAISRPWERRNWVGVAAGATTIVLLLVAIGEAGPYAPYALMRKVPLISQFRLPSRFLLVFTIFAVSTIAYVLRQSDLEQSGKGIRRLAAALFITSVGSIVYWNGAQLSGSFPLAPLRTPLRWMSLPPPPRLDLTTDGFASDSPMLRAIDSGIDLVRCNEPLQLQGSVRPDRPIVFSDDETQISRTRFTPNHLEFRAVVGSSGGRVFLNQRYATGWTSTAGPVAVDPSSSLPFVVLGRNTAGRYEFSFFPPMLVTGTVLWLTGAAAAVVLWRRQPAHVRTSTAGSTAAGQSSQGPLPS